MIWAPPAQLPRAKASATSWPRPWPPPPTSAAQALASAANIGRQSETVSIQAVANQADLNEIVTAVNNAEMTLQTVIAVRDKVIQAYQEIMRMPI